MIKFWVDYDKCRRSEKIDCRNCVEQCLMKILGIKDNRVVMVKPEDCILCLNCQGGCMEDTSVIKVWEE